MNVSHTSTSLSLCFWLYCNQIILACATQLFIFQFICMQLCKCLNYFLKAHNKQLNQYCLNFIIFLTKKKVLKNGLSHRLGWVGPQKKGWVTGQPVFASCWKNRVRVRYFLGWVRKFWSVLPCIIKNIQFNN